MSQSDDIIHLPNACKKKFCTGARKGRALFLRAQERSRYWGFYNFGCAPRHFLDRDRMTQDTPIQCAVITAFCYYCHCHMFGVRIAKIVLLSKGIRPFIYFGRIRHKLNMIQNRMVGGGDVYFVLLQCPFGRHFFQQNGRTNPHIFSRLYPGENIVNSFSCVGRMSFPCKPCQNNGSVHADAHGLFVFRSHIAQVLNHASISGDARKLAVQFH